MPAFQYRPISDTVDKQQVRILELLSGNGEVKCLLHHAALTDKPCYEALSYCWGNNQIHKEISISDTSFQVSVNLHHALISLRQPNSSRFIWVDAICINQDDPDERSAQVRIMRQIYQACTCAIVWLGGEDEYTELAMRLLQIYSQWYAKMPRTDDWTERRQWLVQQNDTDSRTSDIDGHKIDMALRSIFRRPWFTRVWIIQELAVAREAIIRVGSYAIGWDVLAAGFLVASPADPRGFRDLQRARQDFQRDEPRELVDLVAAHLEFKATDPRDKVYALLGLASGSGASETVVDYKKDEQTVWMEFTVCCLKYTTSADVLSLARGCRKGNNIKSQPSWIIDWDVNFLTQVVPTEVLARIDLPPSKKFTACGAVRSQIPLAVTDGKLRLSGYIFDEIVDVNDCHLDLNLLALSRDGGTREKRMWAIHYLLWLGKSYKYCDTMAHCTTTQSPHTDKNDMFFQICKCLSDNTLEDPARARRVFKRRGEAARLFRRCGTLYGHEVTFLYRLALKTEHLLRNWIPRLDDLFYPDDVTTDRCCKRLLFTTRKGFIGLGPLTTQPGDDVALIKSASVPFVLQKSGNNWKVVGESYVHGIMAGEAWNEQLLQEMFIE